MEKKQGSAEGETYYKLESTLPQQETEKDVVAIEEEESQSLTEKVDEKEGEIMKQESPPREGIDGGIFVEEDEEDGEDSIPQSSRQVKIRNIWFIIVRTVFYLYISFIIGVTDSVADLTITLLVTNCKSTDGVVSVIFTFLSIGAVVGSLTSGPVLKYFSERRNCFFNIHLVLFVALLTTFIVMVATPFTPIVYILYVYWFFFGLSKLFQENIRTLLIIWMWKRKINLFLQFSTAMSSTGRIFITVIAVVIFKVVPDDFLCLVIMYCSVSLLYLIACILILFIPIRPYLRKKTPPTPPEDPLLSETQKQKQKEQDLATYTKESEKKSPLSKKLKSWFTCPCLLHLSVLAWAFFLVPVAKIYPSAIMIFCVNRDVLPRSQVADAILVYQLTYVATRMCMICCALLFRPSLLVFVDLFGLLFVLVMQSIFSEVGWMFFVCCGMFGMFVAPLHGSIYSFAQESMGVKATVLSSSLLSFNSIFAAGAWKSGVIALGTARDGWEILMFIMMIGLLVIAISICMGSYWWGKIWYWKCYKVEKERKKAEKKRRKEDKEEKEMGQVLKKKNEDEYVSWRDLAKGDVSENESESESSSDEDEGMGLGLGLKNPYEGMKKYFSQLLSSPESTGDWNEFLATVKENDEENKEDKEVGFLEGHIREEINENETEKKKREKKKRRTMYDTRKEKRENEKQKILAQRFSLYI